MDPLERREIQIDIQGEPVQCHAVLDSYSHEGDFLKLRSQDPHTWLARDARAGNVPMGERLNDHLFQQPDQLLGPGSMAIKLEHGVDDNLSGAVKGHRSATIDVMQFGSILA